MEELIDIYDENGNNTGKSILKSIAHKEGIWHSSIHILIISTDKKRTLFQKRNAIKKLYPNTWDIAVGGHISAGEEAITSAKRELEEELGLDSSKYNLEYMKTVKEQLNNSGVLSKEFVNIFVIYADIDINDLTLQEEEVEEAKWLTKLEMNELINSNKVIPHIEDYEILRNIMI